MTKTRLLLLVCFVAAFAAGTTAGLVIRKSDEHPRGHSWLMAELKLTDQQRDQMGKIWSEVMEASGRQHWEQRRAFAEERDKAIAAMLTPEQQSKHEQILDDYNRKVSELSQERKRAFEEAVQRTKQILTPDQARQYDELMKKQRDRGFGGPGPGPGPAPPWTGGPHPRHGGPRSRPTSDEQNTPRVGE
jgi:Spy/CpxP family protein refolding chaperone